MRMNAKRSRKGLVGLICLGSALLCLAAVAANPQRVVIIGDSTVSVYDSATLYPREGWGMEFERFFNAGAVSVSNQARSGRSTLSFISEGLWATTLASLKSGDILMIQFGHNDQKTTTAGLGVDTAGYGVNLTKFVNEARAKGVHPVFVTPMNRNGWSNGGVQESLLDYCIAMIRTGKKLNVPVLDLEKKSKTFMDSCGNDYTTWFHFLNLAAGEYSTYPDGNADNTHFQQMGAIVNSRMIVEEIESRPNDSILKLLAPLVAPRHLLTVKSSLGKGDTLTRSGWFPAGVPLTLKIRPANGYTFSHWLLDGTKVTTNKRHLFLQDGQAHTAIAVYQGVPIPSGVEPKARPRSGLRIRNRPTGWELVGNAPLGHVIVVDLRGTVVHEFRTTATRVSVAQGTISAGEYVVHADSQGAISLNVSR